VSELFRASEHEPLGGEEWSAEAAEAAIAEIVADAEAAYDGVRWPFHPADEPDNAPNAIYLGVAGMAWGARRARELRLGRRCRRGARAVSRGAGRREYAHAPSYLGGEAGIALVGFRLTGDAALADRLHELVLANLEDRWERVALGSGRLTPDGRGDARLDGRDAVGRGVGRTRRPPGGCARQRRPVDAALADEGLSLLRRGARLRREPAGAREPPSGGSGHGARAAGTARRRARELAADGRRAAGRDSRAVVPRRSRRRRDARSRDETRSSRWPRAS